jgi:head-tail adaptor
MRPAGEYDTKVTFRRRATITPRAGNERGAWQDVARLWAKVQYASATEAIRTGQVDNLESGVVFVRDNTVTRTFGGAMRLVIGTREYEVKGVKQSERLRGEIELAFESAA